MTIKPLLQIFGRRLLCYVLGLAEENETVPENLSPAQVAVIGFLQAQAQAQQLPVSEDTSGLSRFNSLAGFTTYVPDLQTSLANALRRTTGAGLPDIGVSDDPVMAILRLLARDMWAGDLLPTPSDPPRTFWFSTPLGIFQHPETAKLCQAFLADESLTRLFPVDSSSPESTSLQELIKIQSQSLYSNAGHAGSLQLVGLLGFLIRYGTSRSEE